jgi:2-enoate reductase
MAVNELMEKVNSNAFIRTIGKPIIDVDYLCASASPNPNRWSDKVKTRALTISEIQEMVRAFGTISKLCKDAGVDGIEVHAVHEGYLIDQFTMKYSNQRTDEYGGSFENRYRFPVEIVKSIKSACGNDFPVSLRYSVVSKTKGFRQGALPGEEYTEVGRDMAESERAAKYLQDAGYDMLNCDNGTYDAWYWSHPPGYMEDNCNLEYVEHIKQFVDIPVVCAGKMTAEAAARAIGAGKLDGMGVARQFLTDPQWVNKLAEDREADIKPCINCHNACFVFAKWEGSCNMMEMSDTIGMARCALNPMTMQHKKYKIVKTTTPKKVAIIGGGIGGMEAALVLQARGHKPTIYEKSDTLGGVFIKAAAPSFKDKDRALLDWYRRAIEKAHIEVKLDQEVTDLNTLGADEVIIATGALAKKPPVSGIEKAISAADYLGGAETGDKVLIIGGGLTGCEIAYDLILKGKHPAIVEALGDLIVAKGVCLANSSFLREMLAWKKAPVYLNSRVKEIRDGTVIVADKDGAEHQAAADTVIYSVGYTPKPLAPKSKHAHLVGDCNSVGNLRTVIWRAWDVAMRV